MDIVYFQPLKELLQVGAYFKEELVVLVENEAQELKVKKAEMIPCYLVSENTQNIQKLVSKKKAVLGGSVKANEFAVKAKVDFLLQPSGTKQFFDLGLAKKLAEENITTVFLFSELLDKNSFERFQMWKNYSELAAYCKKKKARFFVASGAKEPLYLRPQKMREAIGIILGANVKSGKEVFEGMK
ncbi:MAG: RNase P subunit p30 family protein [archaeon]|jgi:RNase P/RNase MRP subunit p30